MGSLTWPTCAYGARTPIDRHDPTAAPVVIDLQHGITGSPTVDLPAGRSSASSTTAAPAGPEGSLHPAGPAEQPEHAEPRDQHHREHRRVAVAPFEFRHELEVHSID